jgi:hypothetical protein
MFGLTFLFSVELGKPVTTILQILLALILLSIPSNLIKRETIGIYDKDGRVYYWAFVNQKNKAHVEEILAFIFSRIPAEAKN